MEEEMLSTQYTIVKDFTKTPPQVTGVINSREINKSSQVTNEDDDELLDKMINLNLHESGVEKDMKIDEEQIYKQVSNSPSFGSKPGETNYKWLIVEEKYDTKSSDKDANLINKTCNFNFEIYDKDTQAENKKIEGKIKNDKENLCPYYLSSSIIDILPIHLETLQKNKDLHTNITCIIQMFHLLPIPVHVSPVLCLLLKQRMNLCWSSYTIFRWLLMLKELIMKSNDIITHKKKLALELQYKMSLQDVLDYYYEQIDILAVKYQNSLYTADLHPIPTENIYQCNYNEKKDNQHYKTVKQKILNTMIEEMGQLIEKITVSIINVHEIFILQNILFSSNIQEKDPFPLNFLKWPSKIYLTPNDLLFYFKNFLTQHNSYFAEQNMGGHYENIDDNGNVHQSLKNIQLEIKNQQLIYIHQEYSIICRSYKIKGETEFQNVVPNWIKDLPPPSSSSLQASATTMVEVDDDDDDKSSMVIEKEKKKPKIICKEELIGEYRELMVYISENFSSKESCVKKSNYGSKPLDYKGFLFKHLILENLRLLTLEHPKWLNPPQ